VFHPGSARLRVCRMMSLAVVPPTQSVTVFLAAASPLDCQLLATSLQRIHLRVVGWAVNSAEVIARIINEKPGVAIISVTLQDGPLAGLNALREISLSQSRSRLVMLLDASDPEIVVEAFRNGAAGVFSRKCMSSNLGKCIRCILEGQVWVNNQELCYLVEALRMCPAFHANSNAIALLTKREVQVVDLVANGLTNRDIAEHLRLSEHTVKNYMFEIFEKVGVSTRVELVLYALNQHRHLPTSENGKVHNGGTARRAS
jgi:two-component system nitrate/nitrite response regulator NarL